MSDCPQIYDAQVFFADSADKTENGKKALGNSARYFILDRPPTAQWLADAQQRNKTTDCFLWRDYRSVRLHTFSGGREIRFCGHALVGAAFLWKKLSGLYPLLQTPYDFYPTLKRAETIYVSTPRMACMPAAMPPDIAQWFDIAPLQCACAGSENGYYILRWPRGMDIALIKPAFELIARQPRAIVMTQEATDTSVRRRFNLRYLAPQYGVNEDGATGSAAAIATEFWYRFHADSLRRFVAMQCSPSGGVIFSEVVGNRILIGGNVVVQRKKKVVAVLQ
ncbi:MAG TPA: PhzF family phenazine biosynthesis protein [Spongiibacteraceae bacterium]